MSQAASKIPFYACSRASLEQSIRDKRPCDRWLESWADVDPQRTPLAISYEHQIQTQIEQDISDAIDRCEQQRLASEPQSTGLSIRISSALAGSMQSVSTSDTTSAPTTKLSVAFSPMDSDSPCPMLPRELFMESVSFNVQVYGGANGNMAWTLENPVSIQPDPYFELYGRPLRFLGPAGDQYLGQLTLTINHVVDLAVQFAAHPIPAEVADRVDPDQPLRYAVSTGSGYFNIAAVFELTHLDSGAMVYHSIHGDPSAGYLPPWSQWPSGWNSMSPNQQGVIEHGGFSSSFLLMAPDPAIVGLPSDGDFLIRVILLTFGYDTGERWVTSNAIGQNGDGRLSWQPLFFSHLPSLTSYTPGLSEGLMPTV